MAFDNWLRQRFANVLGAQAPAAPAPVAPMPRMAPGPTPGDALLIAALVDEARKAAAGPAPSLTGLGAPAPQTRWGNDEASLMGLALRAAATAPPPPVAPAMIGPQPPAGFVPPDAAAAIASMMRRPPETLSEDPVRARALAEMEMQRFREQEFRRVTEANPSPLRDEANSLASAPGQIPGAVKDAVRHPWQTTKDVGFATMDVMGYPQEQVALGQAEYVYRVAKGDVPGGDFAAGVIENVIPGQGLIKAAGISMTDWAQDLGDEKVASLYENGYEVLDEQGQVIGRYEGREAIVAAFYDSMGTGVPGFLRSVAYQTVTDPTMLLPVAASGGRALRAADVATDASRAAKAAAAAKRAAGTVLTTADEVAQLPEQAVFGTAKAIGKGARTIPYVGDAIDWAVEPSARAAAQAKEAVTRRALETFRRSDAAMPMTAGMTPGDPFGGTNLGGTPPPDVMPSGPGTVLTTADGVEGEIVEAVGDVRILRDANDRYLVVDVDGGNLTSVSYANLDDARAAAAEIDATPVPAAAAPAPEEAAPAAPVDVPTVPVAAAPVESPPVDVAPEPMPAAAGDVLPANADVVDTVGDYAFIRDGDGFAIAQRNADGSFAVIERVDGPAVRARGRFEEIAGTPPDVAAETTGISQKQKWDLAVTERRWDGESVQKYAIESHPEINTLGMSISNEVPGRFNWKITGAKKDDAGNVISVKMTAKKGGNVYEAVATVQDAAPTAAAAPDPVPTPPATAAPEPPIQQVPAEGMGPTVPPDPRLMPHLQPKPGRGLPIDMLDQVDSAAADDFMSVYNEVALKHQAMRNQIDQEAKNLRSVGNYTPKLLQHPPVSEFGQAPYVPPPPPGTARMLNRADKVAEEVAFAMETRSLYRDIVGTEPPPYRYRYNDWPDDLVPANGRWTPATRERFESWWKAKRAEQDILGDAERGAAGDDFNALVERALGPDDVLAAEIRVSLRQVSESGVIDKTAADLAERLKFARSEMYGPDSVKDRSLLTWDAVQRDVDGGKRVVAVASGKPKGSLPFDSSLDWKNNNYQYLVTFDDGTTRVVTARRVSDDVSKQVQGLRIDDAPTAAATPEPVSPDVAADVTNAAPMDAVPESPTAGMADDAGRWRAVQADVEKDAATERGSANRSAQKRTGDPNARGYLGPDMGVVRNAVRGANSLDEALANLDAYGERLYGPRADAVRPGARVNRQGNLIPDQGEVYVSDKDGPGMGKIGRGWKRVDQLKESLQYRWQQTEGLAADAAPPAPQSAAIPETGGAPGTLAAQTAPTPAAATPTTPEPDRWIGQPIAGASRATANNPMIDLWDRAKASKTVDDGVTLFEEYGTKQFGPRDAAVTEKKLLNGETRVSYARGAAGNGWKQIDAQIDNFEAEWLKYRGGPENPYPSGRKLVDGTTPAPDAPDPLTDGFTPFETAGGNTTAAPEIGGTTDWTEFDPLHTARRQGDIDDEQFDLLNQTISITRKVKGKNVTTDERIVDVFGSFLADGMDPDAAIRATLSEMPKIPLKRRGKIANAIAGAYNGMTQFAREHLMFNVLTGPRGVITDQIGDTWTQVQSGHLDAAINNWNIPGVWKVYKNIRGETIDAVAATDIGRRIERLGIAAPRTSGFDLVHAAGAEQVARSGNMTAQKVIDKIARTAGAGDAAAGRISKAGGVLMSERIRDFRTAWDIFRRSNLYEEVLTKELPTYRDEFFDVVRTRAGDAADAEALVRALGDEFSPADVRRLAARAGFDRGEAEFLARQWRSRVSRVDKSALAEVSRVAFDFAPSNADELLKKVFLFHTWQVRAAPLYLRNMLRNPALASAYGNMMETLQRDCEKRQGQQCGLLELWSTGAGYAFFGNPTALLSTALIKLEPDAWQDPDASMLDRVLAQVPAMVNPVFQGVISGIGWSAKQAPDPLATYTFRKTLGGIVDYARAQGWIGEGGSASGMGDAFYAEFLGKLQQAAYDFTQTVSLQSIPWTRPPEGVDPQASDNAAIQARIRDLVFAEYEVPLATDLFALDEQYPEAAAALQDALLAWQTGKANPYADQAFRDYTGNKLIKQGGGSLMQGGVQMRSETQDSLSLLADTAPTGAEQRAARGAAGIARLGSPTSTNLEFQQAAVTNAPGVMGSQILNIWNEIAFGENPGMYTERLGLTNDQVLALSDEERRDLADLWIDTSAPGTRARLEAARAARDTVIAESPEDQAYREWSRGAREMGIPAFRAEMVKGNPNYARYIAGYDAYAARLRENGATSIPTLDDYSINRDAYLAAIGERGKTFDPNPLPTSSGNAPFYPAAAISGEGDGGGSSSASSGSGLTKERLTSDLRKYNTALVLYDQALKSFTGNPDASLAGMNPQLRAANQWHLSQLGIEEPMMPRSVERYQTWAAAQQQNGKPYDIDTYLSWYGMLETAMAGTGLDVDTLMDAAAQGYDPFSGTSLGSYPNLAEPYAGR